jgi:chorismate lyase/3-hydroxybenzoate synthase
VAQVDETMRNIAALLDREVGEGRPCAEILKQVTLLKVFVRRPEHLEPVRSRLFSMIDDRTPALFLRADICRAELLVEIEGLARPARS